MSRGKSLGSVAPCRRDAAHENTAATLVLATVGKGTDTAMRFVLLRVWVFAGKTNIRVKFPFTNRQPKDSHVILPRQILAVIIPISAAFVGSECLGSRGSRMRLIVGGPCRQTWGILARGGD